MHFAFCVSLFILYLCAAFLVFARCGFCVHFRGMRCLDTFQKRPVFEQQRWQVSTLPLRAVRKAQRRALCCCAVAAAVHFSRKFQSKSFSPPNHQDRCLVALCTSAQFDTVSPLSPIVAPMADPSFRLALLFFVGAGSCKIVVVYFSNFDGRRTVKSRV